MVLSFRVACGSGSGHLKGGMCEALAGWPPWGSQLEDNSWLYATRLRKAVCNRLNTHRSSSFLPYYVLKAAVLCPIPFFCCQIASEKQ